MSMTKKERPILFSGAMVRALLDGSKTQTRRIIKPDPGPYWNPVVGVYNPIVIKNGGYEAPGPEIFGASDENQGFKCPYGKPGDRLWVRETWRGVVEISQPGTPVEYGVARYVPDQEHCRRIEYAATMERDGEPFRPSIHMPRWASRILLEIVDVRVERLQDIGTEEIQAEGVVTAREDIMEHGCRARVIDFSRLWESINGAGSWDANPWVWMVEFERVPA